jgi:O-antigen ligase
MHSRLLALQYWSENPIVGLGVGGFLLKPEGGIHTHSTYFTFMVERGVIGLFLFVAFLFQLIRVVRRGIRLRLRENDGLLAAYGIAFLAGLIGLLAGQFLYDMNDDTFWFFLGMALASVNLAGKRSYVQTEQH